MQMVKAALMSAALVAAPAFAQGESPVVVEGGVPTAVVSYADLDIGSPSGLATLNGRLHRAASRICFADGRTDLATRVAWSRCYESAMTGAKAQLDRAIADSKMQLASSGAIKVAAR